jgi:D-hexose-6-phosphate mutarotase
VQDKDGHWYSLRVRPYLTLDNKVDGAVLVLVDIDASKLAQQEVIHTRDFAEAVIGTVRDPLLGRQLVIAKDGSQATVVWNPWIAKAKAMADFGDDEWPGMVCVETVNALDHTLTIPAGGSHHMVARIGTEPLKT